MRAERKSLNGVTLHVAAHANTRMRRIRITL